MKGKDKSSRTNLPDLLKYMANKMSGRERNSLERELQKDPFADEAAEGYSVISPDEASGDMARLIKQLKAKTGKRKGIIYYRIAASVAVLMIISSVYILVNRNKQTTEKKEIAYNITTLEIPESKAIKTPEKAAPEVVQTIKRSESVKEKISPAVSEAEGEKGKLDMAKDAFDKKAELAIASESAAEKVNAREDQAIAAAPAAELDTEKKAVPESSVTSLDEVVVVGYGASKRAKAADENAGDTGSGYLPPQPSGSRKEFNNYIEKNIKNPASLPTGEREVVVVSFTVTSTGSIENIKMLKTPGDEYSKEAIRLIKDGPAWKPAERNGENIDDEVRVRIVFK